MSDLIFDPFATPAPHAMAVGARPLGARPIFHVDPATYAAEVAQRRAILAADPRYYAQALPASEPAQWGLLAWGLAELARAYPQHFELEQDGDGLRWRNALLGEERALAIGGELGMAPIDWLGRQVQEDLLLLAVDAAAGHPLVAGQLCFGNRWCLDDKLGQPLLAIHGPVPGYAAQVGRPTDLLVERLPAGRPVWRRNWSLAVLPDLDLAPRHGSYDDLKAAVTAATAGERVFYRVERQTLARMAAHPAVLFTVRTYVAPVGRLAADPAWAAGLAAMLRAAPPALLAYKGATPYLAPLLAYLDGRVGG